MRFTLTREQEALRDQIRAYFARVLTDDVRASLRDDEAYRAFVRRMGADGWLGTGWPTKYGGKGFTPFEQSIFFEEVMRSGARLPFVTINTVGPTLMLYGTDEQKAFLLPGILRGEIEFAIGYTEPEAGTDLASLQTRAVAVDDGFVINGNKIFTSGAGCADYVWLAARTDPDVAKHKGITIFIVPTSAAGFSYTSMNTLAGPHTFATYYEDVRVPASAVVGEVNGGWHLITTQLNHERAALGAYGPARKIFEDVLAYARERRLTEDPWVRHTLARVDASMEAFYLLNKRVAWALTAGTLSPADASAVKVFGTELNVEVARLLQQVLGARGAQAGEDAPLRGIVEEASRRAVVNTFGGGANEIQRDIIATVGLGLPRSTR
jgi:hypothetical protein